MSHWIPTTCMRCAVGCGHLQRGADVGNVIDVVRGDAAHPVHQGLACQRGTMACTGTELCSLALTETKARTARMLRWLRDNTDLPPDVDRLKNSLLGLYGRLRAGDDRRHRPPGYARQE